MHRAALCPSGEQTIGVAASAGRARAVPLRGTGQGSPSVAWDAACAVPLRGTARLSVRVVRNTLRPWDAKYNLIIKACQQYRCNAPRLHLFRILGMLIRPDLGRARGG